MRCSILHESKCRIRIHVKRPSMSLDEADILEAYLLRQEYVTDVKVFERTGDAVIKYSPGRREELVLALSEFSYEENADLLPDHSSRAINREYQDRIALQIMKRVFMRLFVPAPIRTAVMCVKAAGYIKKGLHSLFVNRKLEVPVLDAVAITVSLIRGDTATAGSVMFLLKLGDTLEEWTHKRSVADLASTMALNVDMAWKLDGSGEQVLAAVRDIEEGERIICATGNMIPLDGIVESGEAMVNQSSMTGESEPAEKRPGSPVYAGTVVDEGRIVISVTQKAGSGRYDSIVRMIEESEKFKSESENRASNMADRFVPYSLAGTLVTLLLTRNVTRAVSVLMVDYSCALKLSMPLAVLSAMNEAGKNRISVKGGKFLEAVAGAETIVFDKTGTLTHARPKLVEVVPFGGNDAEEMLRLAACLEEHYPHSMANAVVDEAEKRGMVHKERHAEVEYVVAHGLASRIDDMRVVIGSYHFVFEDEKAVVPEGEEEKFNALPTEYSCLYMAEEGWLCAAILIEDPLREEAAYVIKQLHSLGITRTVMMTGDSEHTARAVAQKVGVDQYFSEVLPEDKAAFIKAEHESGRKVIMIGDGVNDSPALSEADAGIAVSDGAAIAREVADITISADDLYSLLTLRELSSKLMGRIDANYRFIMSFNTALIVLGALGIIPPSVSALLHNTSTIMISLKSMTKLLAVS
ncbi:MAG: heavy metal translocating P-type ATPase [Lachnospiraceae bacterium]|nr:heavy metal translocating P-type ATPase [Lachnospiraceae bacterium]